MSVDGIYYIATVAAIVAAISATIATIVVVAVAATTSASQSLPRVSLDHGAGELGHAGSTRRSPLLVQPLRMRADAVGLALCGHITSLYVAHNDIMQPHNVVMWHIMALCYVPHNITRHITIVM